jgi:hypothetical protein
MLVGATGLIAAWITPSLLERPILRWLFTGRRLAPTRSNRTLMSLWALLVGGYLMLSVLGYQTASFIILALWLPLGLLVLKRLRLAADES